MQLTFGKVSLAVAAAFAISGSSASAGTLGIATRIAQGRTDHHFTNPTIPSWIRRGTALEYVGYSAYVSNGGYSDPVEVIVNTQVSGVSSSEVLAKTKVQIYDTPEVTNYSWECSATGSCSGNAGNAFQFWVSPSNPTASILGPDGERYSVLGTETYTDPWNRTWAATVLNYQNQNSGVRFTIVYQTKSGLILSATQSFPTEYVTEYYYD